MRTNKLTTLEKHYEKTLVTVDGYFLDFFLVFAGEVIGDRACTSE